MKIHARRNKQFNKNAGFPDPKISRFPNSQLTRQIINHIAQKINQGHFPILFYKVQTA